MLSLVLSCPLSARQIRVLSSPLPFCWRHPRVLRTCSFFFSLAPGPHYLEHSLPRTCLPATHCRSFSFRLLFSAASFLGLFCFPRLLLLSFFFRFCLASLFPFPFRPVFSTLAQRRRLLALRRRPLIVANSSTTAAGQTARDSCWSTPGMQELFSGSSAGDNSAARTPNGIATASPSLSNDVPETANLLLSSPTYPIPPGGPGVDNPSQSSPQHTQPPREQLPPPSRQGRPAPRLSSESQQPAARSRRSGGASSPLSSQSSSAHRDAQPRNGSARLAPIASVSPPATLLSTSATRRSPTSPSPAPPHSFVPRAAVSPSSIPPVASTGNAAERYSTANLNDNGNGAGGSSGIAYRSSGSTSLGASPSKFAASQAPLTPDAMIDKSTGPARPFVRRPRARSPWAITFLTLSVAVLGALLLGLIFKSLVTRQFEMDPKGCRMSYMRPSYAHLGEFDTEHTRFASKYSLYLYREQGVDDETKVRD